MKVSSIRWVGILCVSALAAGCNAPDPVDGDCSANVLTVPFMDSGEIASNLSQMQPLGNIYGPHLIPTAHFYLDLVRSTPGDHNTHSVLTSLVSPGRTRVVAVQPHTDSDTPGTSVQAYRVTLKICKNTYIYLDHLNTLIPSISPSRWSDLTSGPILSAGDLIGTSSSTHAVDVGAFDTQFSAPFIRPDFYTPSYATEADKVQNPSLSFKKCALDYFTASAQDAFLAKNPRLVGPRCGDFAQDIVGRAQGTWFSTSLLGALPRMTGIQSEEPTALSLTHDSMLPDALAFSFGDGVPVTDADGAALAAFSPVPMFTKYYYAKATDPVAVANLENTAFADMKVGNEVHCIRDMKDNPWTGASLVPNRIMLVQMRVDGPADHHPGKTLLRIQARERATCPDVSERHLNNGYTAEYFRD